MIELWTAVQWLEGNVKYWQSVWTSPDILAWSAPMAILLTLSIVWPLVRRRRQAAATQWRRTLAARARA
jgi:ABC-type Fe3+ transport system permease subunit